MKRNNDIESPESVEISYNQEELKEIVEELFRNPQCSEKKQKIIIYLSKIEEAINEIGKYQKETYPENFYSSIKDLLFEIKNVAKEIYKKTYKYDEVLSNTLKELILSCIKPLEDALNEQPASETLFKTQRLYAQQSFVCRQSNLQEELMRHLNNIKKFLKEKDRTPPYCHISYAEPCEGRKEEEYWVQPFLYVLYDHLAAVGIRVVMDIRDNEPGDNIVAFTKEYKDANYIILVGTQSLLQRYYDKRSHVLQDQLTIIQKRFEQDDRLYGRSRIYPLLISGTIETAYPEWYGGYVYIKDGRESDYLKILKDLTDWIYKFWLKSLNKDDKYATLWNEYFKSVPSLPNDPSAVKQEISQNYHNPRYIEELKQKKKKQKSNEEDKFLDIPDEVSSGSVPVFDKLSEIPREVDDCGESGGSSTSEKVSPKIGSNEKLTDDEFNEVPEIINNRNKQIKEIDLSSVDEARAKLNSDDQLILNKDPRIAFLNDKKEIVEFVSVADKKETEVTQMNCNKETSLIFTAGKGDRSVAQLLEKGAGVNQVDKDGRAPLTIAAWRGHQGVVAQLLEKGADANQADGDGAMSLTIAAENGHQDVVAQLLEKGASVNQWGMFGETPLTIAASRGHQGIVAQLLKQGADVNQRGWFGKTPLTIAAWRGHQGVVAQLLEKGADVNQVDGDGATPLGIAAENGHQDVVVQLLEKGADANQADKDGRTPLTIAAWRGHQDVVVQLLEKGADANQADKDGRTPLAIAASRGHQGVVAQLLKQGADVNQKNKDGKTPLAIAAWKGHQGVIAQLLEKGADASQALTLAVCNGQQSMVRQLLEQGADVNHANEYGVTLLYVAAQNGDQGVVKQLLEKGANVNQWGMFGETPLTIAAKNGHEGVVAQLLEKGADVNQADEDGRTPLYIAAKNGYQDVVAQLLKQGANVNQANANGDAPLYIATKNGYQDVVAQLLKRGANVNQANANGEAPLTIAAKNGHQGVVAQLLEKGANVNQADGDGVTPFYVAAQKGHQGVVTQLLEKGADINQEDRFGETSLYIAAACGHQAVVAQLIEKGADVNQAEKGGRAPLYIAAQNGHQGVVAQLLEKGADVNQANKGGVAPLFIAVQNEHEGVVAQLLKKGANVNQKNKDGKTLLSIAAQNGDETMVAQLLEKGANVNQADKDGATPLYIAAANGHQGVVMQLLEKGANVNQADKDGATPLYIAAANGHQGVVMQLLEKEADVNQTNKGGVTPFYIGVQNGHEGVVTQLLKKGVNVNQKNKDGKTLLSIATMRSHFKIAAVLLKAGAKIGSEQKEDIALVYPHLREWLGCGEYEACLKLSDYSLHQEPGVRIEERVMAYYAQGKLDKAFEYLEVLKKKNRQEDSAFIAYSSGRLKMEQGEFDVAIKHYEAALREDKGNNRVCYDRILAELYKTGNPETILKGLEELPSPEVFQNKQAAVYSYHVKGFIYHQCLQHDKALVCFNEALKHDKKDIFTLAKRGFLLLCQGKREEGFKDFDAALEVNPYCSDALARKGYGLALESAFEEAGDYFKRSLDVNPSHFETLLLKGASLVLQNFPKAAKECIEKTFAVSISRSLLIAQHMPQEVKEKIIDYAFDYSFKDKEKLKEVLLVLLRLRLFSEKTPEKVELYLMKAYSEEELNVLLRTVSETSPLYEVLCRIVLNNAKKHQIEKEEREAYFGTKQKELYHQLMQLTDENLLATQKENIQKEIKELVETKEPVDDLRNLLNQCVEPTELGIEYNTRNAFQRLFVSKENFLITQLAEKIEEIDKFIREHSLLSYQSVREAFGIIQAIYHEYQEDMKSLLNDKKLSLQEQKKQLSDLYAPRCRLSMALFRDRYLKKEVQNCLAPHQGEIEKKAGQVVYGTHVVKKCGEVHFKYHHNINPCYPVIEYMVGTLYSLLAKTSYGTAPTEIVKLHHKGYAWVLVASQTIEGINLFDFLTHYPGLIQQFDSHSFSTIIITSLLSNPVDGKPDNYMVQFFKDEKDKDKIKVLGFDNDLAFGEPVVKIHRGTRTGQHFVEVRNVFFFFPQMNSPIDPALCKRLVEESPELLMLEFIRSLQKQDEYYKQLVKEGVLTEKEAKELQLPIYFPREETLGIMYKRLRAIQRCLKKDSQLSHMELFYAIYPEMAKYYEKVASKNQAKQRKNQAKPNLILENIAELYAASAPTLEEAKIILGQESLVTMSRLAIETMKKGECAKPLYPLLKGIEKFVESIRFSEISLERQRQILREIKSLSGIEQLTIRNCEALDGKLLQTLVEDLPTLKRLNLVDCSQIKAENIAMASPRGRVVEIKIMQEKSKKQALTPQFEQFSVQSDKSEKAAGKEEEIMETKKHTLN